MTEGNAHRTKDDLPIRNWASPLASFPTPPIRNILRLRTVRATSGNTRTWQVQSRERYTAPKLPRHAVRPHPNFDLLMLDGFSLLALALGVVDVSAFIAHSVSHPIGEIGHSGPCWESTFRACRNFRLSLIRANFARRSSAFQTSWRK